MNYFKKAKAIVLALPLPFLFLIMKLSIAFLLIAVIQVPAKSYSQDINLNVRDMSLETVFALIEEQSGYVFFYDDQLVKDRKITLKVERASIDNLLSNHFKNLPLEFTVVGDKNIVVKQKIKTTSIPIQDRQVRGQVTSAADGSPLVGVSVSVRGTTQGTQTDNEGRYIITAANGAILVFRSVGFAEKTAVVSASTVNVSLEEIQSALDEVIVVAYGTTTKATNVGSIAQVSSENFENRPLTNVTDALVGSAPGVQGTIGGGAPGAEANIRVRGFGSISASNAPLYVVDGIPYDAGSSGNSGIVNLNPDDIESISILKDAATTALYGSRGANGVIMITTKSGKSGESNFTVSARAGFISRGLPEYDRVDAYEYYPLIWEAYRNSLVHGANAVPIDVANSIASGQTTSYNGATYSDIVSQVRYNPFNVSDEELMGIDGRLNPSARLLFPEDLDWAKAIQRGGKSRQSYDLSYDGGAGKTNYFASLGYTDDRGYLLKSDMKRVNARVNINTQATNWLRTGINLTGSYQASNYDAAGGGGYINPFGASRIMAPIYPVYEHDLVTGEYLLNEDGSRQYSFGDYRPYGGGRHAIWENEMDVRKEQRTVVGARSFLEAQILPQLKAATNFGVDIQDRHNRTYQNPIIGDGAPGGRASHNFYRITSYTWNQTLEYTQSFGQHNVGMLVGHENYAYKYNNLSGGRQDMVVDGILELPNFATITSVNSREDNSTIESYFARASYDFDEKYVLNASARRDGNSKFHPNVRWATFWSVGGAYNISKEDFFTTPWVDNLKIRASYGTVGNDGGLDYYPYQALYGFRNNTTTPGFAQESLQNDSLTWETGKNFDLGIDFSLFKNRLSGSIEYFDRVTDGLIFGVPVPLMNGGVVSSSPYFHEINMNIGSLYNRGIEGSLTANIVRSENFSYSTTLNVTTFKNEITVMPDGQPLIQSGNHAYSVGHSIYDFYLREFYGVDPDNGDALYRTNRETSNTRIINNDTVTTVLGEANFRYTGDSSIPDVNGSMLHNLRYKNFSLSITLTYQLGGKVYDSPYATLMSSGTYGYTLHRDLLTQRWQNPGDITDVPRLDVAATANLSGQSTRFLTDASFLSVNNVTLGYKIPQSWISTAGIKDCYLYATGENLALLSARKGMNVLNSFNGSIGNDYNFSRVISFGARIKF
ncbi:SusC/RagA family TonB-linked outer membrane protein [Parapedobacter koreensis]|uniref:TonB-linked outer membrane protein, SusC/RagA family n=1 Tax=Parapedobacter koreensis TaxID=332977 RepID=A0A1H7T9Y7_9SPHI|nr:SusC/RagA family TonB-linked outer membrane protein [Parapedobacter koreensis]SEL81700.1 TonB-linked outer membrane protein, SusC/RagA family [Parapedobacter koreensis]